MAADSTPPTAGELQDGDGDGRFTQVVNFDSQGPEEADDAAPNWPREDSRGSTRPSPTALRQSVGPQPPPRSAPAFEEIHCDSSREATPNATSRATEVNKAPASLHYAPDQPHGPSSRPPSNTSKRVSRSPASRRSSRTATDEDDNARTNYLNMLTVARGTASTGQGAIKTVSKPESVQIAHGMTYTKSSGFAGIKQLAVASLGRRAEVR